MGTMRQTWQCIQQVDYSLSIDLMDAYSHIPIVKHHHYVLHFVW